MEEGRTKKRERNDVRYLRDVLVSSLGMRGYVLALNRRSVRDDNSSTLFYFLRQQNIPLSVAAASMSSCINELLTQNHKSYQLYSIS